MAEETSIKQIRRLFWNKYCYEKLLQGLTKARELEEQGKTEESEAIIGGLMEMIKGRIQTVNGKEGVAKKAVKRSQLPAPGTVIAKTDKMCLRVAEEKDKEDYLAVAYEYTVMKSMYKDEEGRQALWEEMVSDDVFTCSIIDEEGTYIGYCSIKDLRKEAWELAIELKSSHCSQGYGTAALGNFLKEMAEMTGQRFFCAKVDIDNYASQGLMKKLGGYPDGVCEFLLHGKEIVRFREEHLHLIDDKIRAVAKEFSMDAEDLLGYVLVYRFDMGKSD